MADKLNWLGQHLVLIRHLNLADVCAKEGYTIPPDLADLFEGVSGVQDMVFKLAGADKHKNACELMAYIAHRRAGVWWGYRCVCSINEELRQKPPEEIDFEKIPEPPPPPPYFNFDVPKPDPALAASMDAALAGAKGEAAKSAALVNPAMKKYIANGVENAFQAFERANGVHPMTLLKQMGERLKLDPYAISPDSPIFRMERELKEKLKKQREETIAEIKSQFAASGLPSPLTKNPKMEAHQKKLRDDALNAVYRWVAAPDAENAQKCMDAGNQCAGTPAGLLALSAFWAFGDLMPLGDQAVPTPPGLAANGLDKTLLTCAVQQGGTRKLKERYEEYFRLGVEVLTGADNWEASLASKIMPHEELPAVSRSAPPPPPPHEAPANPASPGSNAGDVRTGSAPVPPPPADSGTRSSPQTPPPGGASPYKRWKPGEEN
ncbi:MAG: hypothetical protein LBD37_06585 [Treponema sp.]|jgi:hypothetical protein|nr:hypothetical protein [Treponema sp.]